MHPIEKLIPLIKRYYSAEDPAHDWIHVERVVANVKKLSQDLNINLSFLIAATYCHDLVNLPKNHPNRSKASTLSAEESAPLLKMAGFTDHEIAFIKSIIIEHSYSLGMKPSSLEAAILQDADRIDALGAIGILRCAAVNTKMKSSFYDAQDPLAEHRELDDKNFMLDHYYVKLFKLPETMNTQAGKELALARVEFMKSYVDQLSNEIAGLY